MEISTEVYFDNLEEVIITELSNAKDKIKIALGWITIGIYFDTFMNLLSKGIKIELVLNDVDSNRSPLFEKLTDAGLKLKYILMPGEYGHMHHKFCIIDEITVLSGSYNWTKNARTNFENIIIIRNKTVVLDKFVAEFDVLKSIKKLRLNNLQNLPICERHGCHGKLVNILIYGRRLEKYGEAIGDVLSVCCENPNEHFEILEEDKINYELQGIEDSAFFRAEQAWDSYADINKEILDELDYEIAKEYTSYSNRLKHTKGIKSTVHAWGRVKEKPLRFKGQGNNGYYVKIYWKDKFINNNVPDRYDTIFKP